MIVAFPFEDGAFWLPNATRGGAGGVGGASEREVLPRIRIVV